VWPSPPRVAEAALDDLFDHPAGVLNIFPNSRITFFMDSKWFFSGPLVAGDVSG
jgi:hypothetical protein